MGNNGCGLYLIQTHPFGDCVRYGVYIYIALVYLFMNMKVVYWVQQIGFIAIRGWLASKGIIASTVTYKS